MLGVGCRVLGLRSVRYPSIGRQRGRDDGPNPPRAKGSWFRVQGSGFRVQGSGCRVQGSGFRGQGSGVRVQGSGLRVQGSGVQQVIWMAGWDAARVMGSSV